MKKIHKLIFFYFLSSSLFATGLEVKYKDITNEHWAYKSIENLTRKGILDINTEIFNGQFITIQRSKTKY